MNRNQNLIVRKKRVIQHNSIVSDMAGGTDVVVKVDSGGDGTGTVVMMVKVMVMMKGDSDEALQLRGGRGEWEGEQVRWGGKGRSLAY